MVNKSEAWTYQWRLIITLLGLILVAMEAMEHGLQDLSGFNFDFWAEVLMFGVLYPLAGLMMVHHLVGSRKKQVPLQRVGRLTPKNKGKNTRRVLVVGSEFLLGAGLKHMLTGAAQFSIKGIVTPDEETLIAAINHHQADVIIFDKDSLLKIPLKRLTPILDYPDLHIVILNTENNQAQIYGKQQLVITQFTELVELIHRC